MTDPVTKVPAASRGGWPTHRVGHSYKGRLADQLQAALAHGAVIEQARAS
jgi:hypothetical protein